MGNPRNTHLGNTIGKIKKYTSGKYNKKDHEIHIREIQWETQEIHIYEIQLERSRNTHLGNTIGKIKKCASEKDLGNTKYIIGDCLPGPM